jgi:diguanylate cyclase
MKIFTTVLFCLAMHCPYVFANSTINVNGLLSEANELRTADAKQSKKILEGLDPTIFNQQQDQLYRYLLAYNLSMTGQLEQAIQALESLQTESLSDAIRQRSLASLIIWYTAVQNWQKGLQTVAILQEKYLPTLTGEALDSANLSLVVFYNQLGQYDLASTIANSAINKSPSPIYLCKITSEWLSADLHLQPEQLKPDDFDKSLALCESTNSTVQKQIVLAYKAEYWLKKDQPDKAKILLESTISATEKIDYPQLTAGYYDLMVQAYEKLGELNNAEKYARLNINNASLHQYIPVILNANKVLAKIAEHRGDYQNALSFFKHFLQLESKKFDLEFTKLLAIQNAKLDNVEKSNHINLLDKENALLRSQTALNEKQSQNERLVLMLITLLCLGIIVWAYRSRRFHKQFRKIAQTDELTGISNRAHFRELCATALTTCRKANQAMSFIIFDLDHFKKINDTHGHLIGD